MLFHTTKKEVTGAIDEVSEAASKAVKETLARRVEYPAEVNSLFEAIGRLRAVVEHLAIEKGEAGSEAAMPLTRMANGNLGVESSGGGRAFAD